MLQVDPINYMAIEISERLGINVPNEKHIAVLESILSNIIVYRSVFFDEHLNQKERAYLLLAALGKSPKKIAALLKLN